MEKYKYDNYFFYIIKSVCIRPQSKSSRPQIRVAVNCELYNRFNGRIVYTTPGLHNRLWKSSFSPRFVARELSLTCYITYRLLVIKWLQQNRPKYFILLTDKKTWKPRTITTNDWKCVEMPLFTATHFPSIQIRKINPTRCIALNMAFS